jgi:hypothetical protein
MKACRKVCGPTALVIPSAAGDPADDPPGTVPVQPAAVLSGEHRSLAALADREVDGAGVRAANGMVTTLPPLRVSPGCGGLARCHRLDVGADGLGYSQPVQGEQAGQRVLGGRAEAGGPRRAAPSRAPSR